MEISAEIVSLARGEIESEFSPDDLSRIARARRQSVNDLIMHLAAERARERVARLSRGSWTERAMLRVAGQEVGND